MEKNIIGDVTASEEIPARDVVEVFLNTGLEDIGFWELIDLQGISHCSYKNTSTESNIKHQYYSALLGNSYTILTPNAHSYDILWMRPQRLSFEFQVRACADAHVAMKSGEDFSSAAIPYEIVIGQ